MVRLVTLALATFASSVFANSYADFDNDFIDPSFILAKNFSPSTAAAQQTIVDWADWLAEQGPWCM